MPRKKITKDQIQSKKKRDSYYLKFPNKASCMDCGCDIDLAFKRCDHCQYRLEAGFKEMPKK